MARDDTSIRVSRETVSEFQRMQRALNAKTADETLRLLLKAKRNELLAAAYGSAGPKLGRFQESD